MHGGVLVRCGERERAERLRRPFGTLHLPSLPGLKPGWLGSSVFLSPLETPAAFPCMAVLRTHLGEACLRSKRKYPTVAC